MKYSPEEKKRLVAFLDKYDTILPLDCTMKEIKEASDDVLLRSNKNRHIYTDTIISNIQNELISRWFVLHPYKK